jgi:hypothetical protein
LSLSSPGGCERLIPCGKVRALFSLLSVWLRTAFSMHIHRTRVRRLLTLHAFLMFQSKGLPAFLGNRFFLELHTEKRKSSKIARRQINCLLYMDENVTCDGKPCFTRRKCTLLSVIRVTLGRPFCIAVLRSVFIPAGDASPKQPTSWLPTMKKG